MKVLDLVYSKEFGRGIVAKISPSKSIILVRFKSYGPVQVISSSLVILNDSYE